MGVHAGRHLIGATRSAELRNAMILAAAIYLAVLWLTFEPLGNHGVWLSMLVFMAARSLILGAMYQSWNGTPVRPSTSTPFLQEVNADFARGMGPPQV